MPPPDEPAVLPLRVLLRTRRVPTSQSAATAPPPPDAELLLNVLLRTSRVRSRKPAGSGAGRAAPKK